MPDLVQGVIPNLPRFGVVFALFPLCFKVFAWVEDRLSISAKEEISAWLKSTEKYATNQILLSTLSHFHGHLFGSKQFSVKCVVRTILFSFISYILIFSPLFIGFVTFIFNTQEIKETKFLVTFPWQAKSPMSGDWIGGVSGIIVLLLLFVFVILPLDFVGIGVTRALAMRAKNDIGLKKGLFIFSIDTLAKTIVFPIIYLIFGVVIFVILITIVLVSIKLFIHGDVPVKVIDIIDIVITNADTQIMSTLYGAFALYKSLVPCFLLCSAWVWLYLIGLHLVRRAVFLFDVDKQPVRSIGTIGAALLTVCYGLYTAIGPNLSLGSPLSPDEIAHLEQQNSDSTLAGLNAAIRFNPKSPGLLTLRAGAYWQKHNYDAAIADLDAAIGLNPTSASLFVARGNNYHAKQDYDRAIADNTEAIRLDSSYAIAFNNRGWAYAAKQDYRQLHRVDPARS